jgi:hypothetical protein
MALAFKEWEYIVNALGKGKQSIILRKGGIAEEQGDFDVRGKEFILFPTLFHQAHEMIKPKWLPFLTQPTYHQNQKVRIKYFAKVVDAQVITDWEVVMRLSEHHAWETKVIEERFNRWDKKIQLLIVQVFEFGAAFDIEMLPAYDGCKSWIDIDASVDFIGRPIVNSSII